MAIDTRGTRTRRAGNRIAAALAAAGLSAMSVLVLVHGLLGDSEVLAWAFFAVAMALVAAATVVGTLWSGLAVGPPVAVLPVSVVTWVGVLLEGDPLGGVVGFFVTSVASIVSALSWGATFAVVTYAFKKGWPNRRPARSMR